jgi:hypothetical protein
LFIANRAQLLNRIYVKNCGSHGFSGPTNTAAGTQMIECRAESNGGSGFNVWCNAIRCVAKSNTSDGFATYTAIECISRNNGGYGFNPIPCTLINCVAYKNANGISIGRQGYVSGCIAYGNTTNGITISSGGAGAQTAIRMINCASGGNSVNFPTATPDELSDVNSITLIADPFVDGDNGNFALAPAAPGSLKGVLTTFWATGNTTNTYLDIGAAESSPTATVETTTPF